MANIDWKSLERYSQKVIYISWKADESKGQDGSVEKPFVSIEAAAKVLGRLNGYVIVGGMLTGGTANG